MIHLNEYFYTVVQNSFVRVVAVAIMLDTFLGCLRALMGHKFNSSFGINGAIRKAAIIGSVAFLMMVDNIMHVDLIGFIPDELKSALGLSTIGIGGFFCVLYIIYESISILKNWYLIGLPSPPVFKKVLTKFLNEISGSENASENSTGAAIGNVESEGGAA